MSRQSVLLNALSRTPVSTSDLYDRVGYVTLVRIGLVSYHAFREALVELAAAGLAVSEPGEDGSTGWRLP